MTDKLIVFFTNIKNRLIVPNGDDEFSYTLRNASLHNAAKGNSVAISAYFVDGDGDPFQNEMRLGELVDQSIVRQMGMHCLIWIFSAACYLHEPHRELCPSNQAP